MRPALLLLTLAVLGTAIAQQYRIDNSGGPLTLAEEVAEAAAAWTRLDEGLELTEDATGDALIGFGDPELMGPDVVSVTLIREQSTGLEVRLNPELYRDYGTALLHEIGLLLGLPATSEGVMNPLLTAQSPTLPTEVDLASLSNQRERLFGDLDGDGVVGLEDLAELGRAFGGRGVNLPADLDGDGEVGTGDVELLRGVYRFVPPSPQEVQVPGAPEGGANADSPMPDSPADSSAPDRAGSSDVDPAPDSDPPQPD